MLSDITHCMYSYVCNKNQQNAHFFYINTLI